MLACGCCQQVAPLLAPLVCGIVGVFVWLWAKVRGR